MKAKIFIVGQLNGNQKLRNACETSDCIDVISGFSNYILCFNSKKDAVTALKQANKTLIEYHNAKEYSNYSYTRGQSIILDASKATICYE